MLVNLSGSPVVCLEKPEVLHPTNVFSPLSVEDRLFYKLGLNTSHKEVSCMI